ncbi:MAG: DUF3303 domain-containing protein [Candidatus Heimdallarchaeota archaeon]
MSKYTVFWLVRSKENVSNEVRDRFMQEGPPQNIDYLYPISTILGKNKAFCIAEVASADAIVKATGNWTDLCIFKFMPIMESADALKLLAE